MIVPVYNDAVNLRACLEAIRRSEPPVEECIVGDDGSTDDSGAVARALGAAVVRLERRSGPAAARNAAAAAASSEVLFFADADVCVHPDAIARAGDLLGREPALDAVIGAYDTSPSAPGFISQYRNLQHSYVHRVAKRDASTFWCGCGAVRRRTFLELGGLDTAYTRPCVEDIEFGYRLRRRGGRIALDPDMQVQHRKRWTIAGMLRCDILDRALPWTDLIHRYRDLPNDLNVAASQRASAALVLAAVAGACAGYPLISAALLVPAIWLNRGFYRFLRDHRGLWFAARAVPLHLLYFAYSALAFAFGTLRWRLRSSTRQRSAAPTV